jgi:hypothetical protein
MVGHGIEKGVGRKVHVTITGHAGNKGYGPGYNHAGENPVETFEIIWVDDQDGTSRWDCNDYTLLTLVIGAAIFVAIQIGAL